MVALSLGVPVAGEKRSPDALQIVATEHTRAPGPKPAVDIRIGVGLQIRVHQIALGDALTTRERSDGREVDFDIQALMSRVDRPKLGGTDRNRNHPRQFRGAHGPKEYANDMSAFYEEVNTPAE
jgi:hypothetical protein